jgi:hypothetical protein
MLAEEIQNKLHPMVVIYKLHPMVVIYIVDNLDTVKNDFPSGDYFFNSSAGKSKPIDG